MINVDIHTHTVASGHGTNDKIADMVKAAIGKNMQILGISDHGPATLGAGTVSYFRSLRMAARERNGLRMLYGVELNILNGGCLDLTDDVLSGLDYSIASMHMPPRHKSCLEENTADYIKAMRNRYVTVIGHCDNTQFPVDYFRIVNAAAENNVIMEVNNASLKPNGYHHVPGINTIENYVRLLLLCKEASIPILISSDTHGSEGIGEAAIAEDLVSKVDYPASLIVNNNIELLFHKKNLCR